MVTRPCAAGTQLAAPEETVSLNEMLSPVAAVALGATPRNPVAIARATGNIAFFMKISPYYLVFVLQILDFCRHGRSVPIFRIVEMFGSVFEFAFALLCQPQDSGMTGREGFFNWHTKSLCSLCLLKYSFSISRSCNRARHRRAFTAAGLNSRTSAV